MIEQNHLHFVNKLAAKEISHYKNLYQNVQGINLQ